MSTDEKIRLIRFKKTMGKTIYGIVSFTVLALIFINLASTSKIQSSVSAEPVKVEVQSINEVTKSAIEVNSEPQVTTSEFTITHYCSCSKCCGKSDGITAVGTIATENRTIAVDPNIIPLGSKVLIDGQVYIAEDVGGAIKGNIVDIYVGSHQEAINRGKIVREVSYELL